MDNEVLHDLSDFNVRLEFLKGLKSSSTLLRLNTAGISMRPLIEEQSTVGILFVRYSKIQPGDIILFYTSNAFVLHRVMKCIDTDQGMEFVEKGDYQPFTSTISDRQYLGKLLFIENKSRTLDLRTWRGRLLTISIYMISKLEIFLYAVKFKVWGEKQIFMGKLVMAIFRMIKRVGVALGTTRSQDNR